MAKIRHCLWCKHLHYDAGQPDYSDVTPGYDACIECVKGCRPDMDNGCPSIESLRKNTAEHCPHFEWDE